VHSFVELTKYLLSIPGVTVFMSNRLSQDPIEKFFGQQRQRGSFNDNPNVSQFVKGTQALTLLALTSKAIVVLPMTRPEKWIADKENKSLPKRKNS